MSETVTHETPDLSTPIANAMKLWRSEMERFFAESEKGIERSVALSKKLLDEQARMAEAQIAASQDALRAFADGVARMAKAGTEQR